MKTNMHYKMIVIGTSAGGFKALKSVLAPLPNDFSIPIAIVHHQPENSDDYIVKSLSRDSHLIIKFAEHDEKPIAGHVYLAPPGQHLQFQQDGCFRLSRGQKVNYSRPSIDVLFESAAGLLADATIGVILTGANSDGTKGMSLIKRSGGLTIVQDPQTAEVELMPAAAIKNVAIDYIVDLDQVGPLLWDIQQTSTHNSEKDTS